AEGLHFLTMEFVEGKTLSELIPGKGMPLNRFFERAIPLAEAVSAAHQKGITHRDLKPDNIMVSAGGRLKILDFGLAKLKEDSPGGGRETEIRTEAMRTEAGTILGTVAYMSPEQAEGKPVGPRSDVFSLGIILYEAATGRRPFQGDTKISLISSILRDKPPSVTQLNSGLPRHLGRILKRCLAKDPARRYQNAEELHNELLELKEEIDSGELSPSDATAFALPARKQTRLLYGSLIALSVIAAGMGYLLFRGEKGAGVRGEAPMAAAFSQITDFPGPESFPSLSPDGKAIVYSRMDAGGTWNLYRQRVGGKNPVNLTRDSSADNWQPAFSPDGEWIAFRSSNAGGGIFVMGATGESVRRLTDFGFHPVWSPDGKEILMATEGFTSPRGRSGTSRLYAVNVQDGKTRQVFAGDAVQPSWSPHGQRIAFWGVQEASGQRDLWTVSANGGESVPVTEDPPTDWNPVWSPDGRYLYFSSDRGGSMNLWRVPIEEDSGTVTGPPQPVTTGVSDSAYISISRNGKRIAYATGKRSENLQKVSFDPAAGTVTASPEWITQGSRQFTAPDPSPDGEWITFRSVGKQEDIFVIRADGTGRRQLTNDLHKARRPRWTPDGKRISFYSDRSGSYEIWTIHPDGSELLQITDIPDEGVWWPVWSPDGTRLAYPISDALTSFILDLEPERQDPSPLPPPGEPGAWFNVFSWSPDGKRLAGTYYTPAGSSAGILVYSLESGKYDRLSHEGANPLWLGDSRRVLYSDGGKLFLLDTRSRESRKILSLDPDSLDLSGLSSDYRTLFFSRVSLEADIWVLDLE
ncbi:MAG: protein kinase, partial [Acidobacteria bacterium]|nr:protein kinase [Acidobacteriota bacterium]